MNGKKFAPPERPVKTMGGIDFPYSGPDASALLFESFRRGIGEMRVIGSIVNGLIEVALGQLSFNVHSHPMIWDVGAAMVFLRESGRRCNLNQDGLSLDNIVKRRFYASFTIAAVDDKYGIVEDIVTKKKSKSINRGRQTFYPGEYYYMPFLKK